MTTKGDSQFPSTSLSVNGNHAKIHRTPSHEALAAHPLLSPGTSQVSASSTNSSPESIRVATPKYLPYTPRHRPPTGTVTTGTTGTTVSSPMSVSPQQHQGIASATSKLQLQNLKAAAQNLGLDAGSPGWAMLEELVSGFESGPAWNEIWGMITAGKATLLLPLEHTASHEVLTPECFKDHIAFCNGSARGDAPLVTMSGLRGCISENLSIRSAIPTSSQIYNQLTNPSTRSTALKSLSPLPLPALPLSSYPEFLLTAYGESLPLPPRNGLPPKPPLPPRPGIKAPAAQSASRLSNPFASFFSKPATPTSSPAILPSDPPSVDHVVEISVFIIDRPIDRRTVVKSLTKTVKNEIKESLGNVPSWVLDRVQTFCSSMLPFPRKQRSTREGTAVDNVAPAFTLAAYEELPDELEDAFQAFYESLEEELEVDGSPTALKRRDDKHDDDESGRTKDTPPLDAKIRDVLERVERTLCCVFYDRLFRPYNSDDAQHDEALSSRIAALNMLDVTLDHLGVDAGLVGPDVDSVVRACGETISQLQVARCPADKSAILVAAHNIIVDGLSRLPPLHLKSDQLPDSDKTARMSSVAKSTNESNGTDDTKSRPAANPDEGASSASAPALPADTSVGISESSSGATLRHLDQMLVDTPLLSLSPPRTPTAVSGDILLPLIIFSVVKANPSQLVSHLLYTQRYRNKAFGGEESYCLINLMAVVEFLENVDLAALGLRDSESKILSTADLTPIPLAQAALNSEASQGKVTAHPGLRGRVEQQVDAIAGSANKVLSGVVDSSFGVLRSLLPANVDQQQSSDGTAESAPWNNIRPGFGILRRESGFSISSLAASLPRGRERSKSVLSHASGEQGQEMVESRPGSIRDVRLGDAASSDDEKSGDASSDDDSDDDEDVAHDTKSIRSFESMMSINRKRADKRDRLSISDRLASMSRLTRMSGGSQPEYTASVHHGSPPPRSSSLQATVNNNRFDTPSSSRAASPVPEIVRPKISPPVRRFMECAVDDLKMSEIPELLHEYRRLVEHLRATGAFDETSP